MSAGLAEDRVADRLRELAQLRHEAIPLRLVRDAHLYAARQELDATLERRAGLAQNAPHVVAKLGRLRAQQVLDVDLEEDVRSALEIEAEHDRPRRHQPGRDEARQGASNRLPLLAGHQARNC